LPPFSPIHKGIETASNETLVSGHHSIKSGSNQHNPSPQATYYNVRAKNHRRSEPMENVELKSLNRCALGTVACIGDFTDCIRERVSEVNMFGDNSQLPLSAITINKLVDQRTPIFETDNYKKKIKFLHVDEEQIVSYYNFYL
jgi:hypothetical protein